MKKNVLASFVMLIMIAGACSKESSPQDDAVNQMTQFMSKTGGDCHCSVTTITKNDFDNLGTEFKGNGNTNPAVTIANGITLGKTPRNDHELIFSSNVAPGSVVIYIKNGNVYQAFTFDSKCMKGTTFVFSGKTVSLIKYGKFVPAPVSVHYEVASLSVHIGKGIDVIISVDVVLQEVFSDGTRGNRTEVISISQYFSYVPENTPVEIPILDGTYLLYFYLDGNDLVRNDSNRPYGVIKL